MYSWRKKKKNNKGESDAFYRRDLRKKINNKILQTRLFFEKSEESVEFNKTYVCIFIKINY